MTSLNEHLIDTHGLTKRFSGHAAAVDVDLRVPRGSVFGFLGHNGAGKTTVIRLILGLTRPDAGTVRLRGLDIRHELSRALYRVGAIVEEPRFHGHLSGRENLLLSAAARGGLADRRIEASIDRVGLTDHADERVSNYSQGMRQRLGIARCLLADPELLILDEPTNGLDPAGIRDLRQLIDEFVGEGRTVFLCSHQLDEVERVCDRVAVIDRGRIIAQGTLAEINGTTAQIELSCDDTGHAIALLSGDPFVGSVTASSGRLRVTPNHPDEVTVVAAALNRRLVRAGIGVSGLATYQPSLEERFVELTSTLGASR